MKINKLLVNGIILTTLGITILGSQIADAATYPDATNANSTGKIIFEETGSTNIVDPTNPDAVVTPDNPNPNTGDLLLQYVSDFDFGTNKKTLSALSVNALADTVTDQTSSSKSVPSFVSTKDMRSSRGNGWSLTVTASPFQYTDSSSNTHTITGGVVALSGLNYAGTSTANPTVNSGATGSNSLELTPGTEFTIASADKDHGLGSYSLALGSLTTDASGVERTSGVTFKMPANTVVDSTQYTATFDWELKPTV